MSCPFPLFFFGFSQFVCKGLAGAEMSKTMATIGNISECLCVVDELKYPRKGKRMMKCCPFFQSLTNRVWCLPLWHPTWDKTTLCLLYWAVVGLISWNLALRRSRCGGMTASDSPCRPGGSSPSRRSACPVQPLGCGPRSSACSSARWPCGSLLHPESNKKTSQPFHFTRHRWGFIRRS